MDTQIYEQISAEQILKEVYEKRKVLKPSTKVDILDLEELKEYQKKKRSEYESYLKRNRLDIGQWIRYAQFEIDQHDIRRARSIFERALQINKAYIPLWVRYIDAEIKLKYINHARNLMDRAINTLPRVDKLWYKYLFMEESLQHYDLVRKLFDKWISLEPAPGAWDSYVDFEIRHGKIGNVRQIYAKYVMVHPRSDTWLRWVHFEAIHGNIDTTRQVYSLSIDTLVSFKSEVYGDDTIRMVISFISWEARQQEFDRCKALFEISIKKWPESASLKKEFVSFEKKFGDPNSVSQSVIYKRREHYEGILKQHPRDYETWWIYLDVIQNHFEQEMYAVLEECTINSRPEDNNKSVSWRRYILIWIRFLVYVELHSGNTELCRDLFRRLINDIIPHRRFTFSKIWILYAKFEIRHDNVNTARKFLGRAIGMCPKKKTFKGYIDLEIKLKEFDRVRKIYERFLEFAPSDPEIWIDYAELEENLGDEDRSRGIYEIALSNPVSSFSPEALIMIMERFIEFENDVEEYGNARKLYERYLELTNYSVNAWVQYAHYESLSPTETQLQELLARKELTSESQKSDEEQGGVDEDVDLEVTEENKKRSRMIFERGLKYFKEHNDPVSRAVLMEEYKKYEELHGDPEDRDAILQRIPQVAAQRMTDANVKDEYIFPDDKDDKKDVSKLLDLARKWKNEQNV